MDEPRGTKREDTRLAGSRPDVSAAPAPGGTEGVRISQYSIWQTLGVWAAVALPMAALA